MNKCNIPVTLAFKSHSAAKVQNESGYMVSQLANTGNKYDKLYILYIYRKVINGDAAHFLLSISQTRKQCDVSELTHSRDSNQHCTVIC